MAASKIAMASLSLTHFRPLSSASMPSLSPSFSSRLVAHPPDLIKWVRRECGFVHHALNIAPSPDAHTGLGLLASDRIPKGSELIVLPHNLPLRFESLEAGDSDEADSVLVNLARQVPGIDRILSEIPQLSRVCCFVCVESCVSEMNCLLWCFLFSYFLILDCIDFCTLNSDFRVCEHFISLFFHLLTLQITVLRFIVYLKGCLNLGIQ